MLGLSSAWQPKGAQAPVMGAPCWAGLLWAVAAARSVLLWGGVSARPAPSVRLGTGCEHSCPCSWRREGR